MTLEGHTLATTQQRSPRAVSSRRRRQVVSALAALAVVVALFAAAAPATAADQSAINDWLSRINSFRQSNGLGALSVDGQLQSLAQNRADANARSGRLEHTPDLTAGLTSNWVKLGENVGTGPNHDMIWTAFLNSAPHRANLLDPNFTHVGIGETVVNGTIWVTHRFMKLGSTSTAPAPAPVIVNPSPAPSQQTPVVVPAPPTTKAPAARSTPTTAAGSGANGSGGSGGAGGGGNGDQNAPTGAASGESAAGGGEGAAGADGSVSPTGNATAVVDALRVLQQ